MNRTMVSMDDPYAHGETEVNSMPGLDSIFFSYTSGGYPQTHKTTSLQSHGPTHLQV